MKLHPRCRPSADAIAQAYEVGPYGQGERSVVGLCTSFGLGDRRVHERCSIRVLAAHHNIGNPRHQIRAAFGILFCIDDLLSGADVTALGMGDRDDRGARRVQRQAQGCNLGEEALSASLVTPACGAGSDRRDRDRTIASDRAGTRCGAAPREHFSRPLDHVVAIPRVGLVRF